MLAEIKKIIAKIRNSDETTKKFLLIIMSSAAMIFVIGIWVANLNYKFSALTDESPKETPAAGSLQSQTKNFKEIFAAGIKNITGAVKNKLAATKDFSINGAERNFILDNLEKIPNTQLP